MKSLEARVNYIERLLGITLTKKQSQKLQMKQDIKQWLELVLPERPSHWEEDIKRITDQMKWDWKLVKEVAIMDFDVTVIKIKGNRKWFIMEEVA